MLEEVSGTGMLRSLLIIFLHIFTIFFIFARKRKKNENALCPLPFEEVLEDIIRTVWMEQFGNHKEMRYLGKAALVYPGKTLVKFCSPALHFLTNGKKWKFQSNKDENPSNFFFFLDSLKDKK